MAACETIKVVTADGYKVINKSDFDKSKHKLYREPLKADTDDEDTGDDEDATEGDDEGGEGEGD